MLKPLSSFYLDGLDHNSKMSAYFSEIQSGHVGASLAMLNLGFTGLPNTELRKVFQIVSRISTLRYSIPGLRFYDTQDRLKSHMASLMSPIGSAEALSPLRKSLADLQLHDDDVTI